MGPGPTSFAWSPDGTRDRVVPQRGRLRSARGRSPRDARRSARELSKGWHRGLDWGARASRACAPARRTAAAGRRARPATGPRGARARGRGRRSSTRSTSRARRRSRGRRRRRDRARPVVATARPPVTPGRPAAARRSCTADRPARRPPTGSPRSSGSCRAAGRCCSPNYRGSTGYGARLPQALARRWGDVDVADTVAGIRAAVKEGWCDAEPGRGDGRQRRRLHRAARRRARTRSGARRGERCTGSPISSTSPRRRTGSSRATSTASSGPLPEHADRYEARSPVTHAREIACRCSCSRAPTTRWCRPRRRSTSSTVRAAGGTVEHHVYEGEGHGFSPGSHHRRRPSTASTRSSRDGWSDDDSPRTRRR